MTSLNDIVAIYEKLIVIPEVKPSPQFYLVPVGLVGAGKTTVLKPLSEKLHLVRISGDEIREVIKDNDGDPDDTWEVGRILVSKYAERGYSIAHDTDGATVKTQEAIAKQADEYGLKVLWIHIDPPESFIINKLQNYDYRHSYLFSDAEDAISRYRGRKPLHETLPMNFVYTFDTSAPDISQQIERAIHVINQELHG